MDNNQKPWENAPDEEEVESMVQPEPAAKYEVVRKFSVGRVRQSVKVVYPGNEVPDKISDVAIASLLRKGVLKEL